MHLAPNSTSGQRDLGQKKIYLGTWGFSGSFTSIKSMEIPKIISYAQKLGINHFDTASAYGNGSVEKLLGTLVGDDGVFTTKVASKNKPSRQTPIPIEIAYPIGCASTSAITSRNHLNCRTIDTLLLHNWSEDWSSLPDEFLFEIAQLRRKKLINRFGISLPNGFNGQIAEQVLDNIQVIEAPFNTSNQWILGLLPKAKAKNIEVILRSIFHHGLALRSSDQRKNLPETDTRSKYVAQLAHTPRQSHRTLLLQGLSHGTSLTFGVSNSRQLLQNIRMIEALDT